MSEILTVTTQRTSLSRLLWRRYRRPTPGLAEKVYAANPGLSDSEPFLPLGAKILVPTLNETAPAARVVQLWE